MKLIHLLCAVLFCAFTFLFLFYYQGDVLAVGQHVLSGGQTSYNRTIGAVLITLVLFLLQAGIYALTRLTQRSHALTYFPSFLTLAVITSVSPAIDKGFSLGPWLWAIPVLLVIYVAVVWVARQFNSLTSGSTFQSAPWINLLLMAAMMVFTGLCSNHNDVFHYRMRAENALLENDLDAALSAGKRSLANDSSLTMLRAYALAQKGQLAERLLEYTVMGGAKALLPDGSTVKAMMYPQNEIAKFYKLPTQQYHFKLMSLLLDKQIDKFASTILRFYPNDSTHITLPKHYREAMTLYTHLRSNRVLTFKDPVMEADYEDFQQIRRSHADATERRNSVRDKYANTYWYYYEYGE